MIRMKRLYKYIIPLFLSVVLSDEITLIGDSDPFIADTKYPILEWIAPEVGDQFNGNETIVLEWDIEEEKMTHSELIMSIKNKANKALRDFATSKGEFAL